MALIFIGTTECPLCGKVLLEDDEITGLGPSAQKDHELYKYFDCGFHAVCFETWDRKEEAITILREEEHAFRNSDQFKERVRTLDPHNRADFLG